MHITPCSSQILVTELGDETFIIAAIMAMRHSRMVVYLGAMSALTFMTVRWLVPTSIYIYNTQCPQVISTALGYVLPNIISPTATHHLATVLYTIFGVRLLWIGWKAEPHDNKVGVAVCVCAVNPCENHPSPGGDGRGAAKGFGSRAAAFTGGTHHCNNMHTCVL